MKLRESIRRIVEGPIVDDKPRPPLRDLSFAQNDQRPGLPTPTPRKDVTWQQPAPTAAPVTLPQQLSPDSIWSTPGSVKIQIGPTGQSVSCWRTLANGDSLVWKAEPVRHRAHRPEGEADGLMSELGSQPTIQSLEILEESIQVKRYRANCPCGRVFTHRDKRTLECNINTHLVRYHDADAEYRAKMEFVKKELGRIRKRLNRLYGV